MAFLLRCLLLGGRDQCNTTMKLGLAGSHLTRHHHIPSWSFFTTRTTTLPAEEGSIDEHHHRREAKPLCKSLGGGLGNLGVASWEKQRDAEINPRLKLLGRFAAFDIGSEEGGKKIEFVRVVSAKVQLVKYGRLYYITMEAFDSEDKKLYEVHVLDTLTENRSVSLIEWCELKSPPKSSTQHS